MKQKQDYWFQIAVLIALTSGLAYMYFQTPDQTARAAGGGWDTNGVMALNMVPGLERLVLIDTNTNKQNICVYKNRGAGSFRLVGARCYKYDIELKDTTGTWVEKRNGITFLEAKQIYDQREKDK